MSDVRREIARVVEAHLDEMLDVLLDEYRRRIPRFAAASPQVQANVREGTRRATLAFLTIFSDPERPARPLLAEARRIADGAAAAPFEREDLLAMVRIARPLIFSEARAHVVAALGTDPARTADISQALDAFLQELVSTGERLEPSDDAIAEFLARAEAEGQDLA